MASNRIEGIEVTPVEGPEGPTVAMMIGIEVGDVRRALEFVADVLERFKAERMIAPPETSMLLVTIIGDLGADAFAERWKALAKADAVAGAFMGKMIVADAVQGTDSGEQLSSASLLADTIH